VRVRRQISPSVKFAVGSFLFLIIIYFLNEGWGRGYWLLIQIYFLLI